ncbi:alpha-beta hydrolase superfamily lysophospholipase [Paraburkholderia sp. BL8N3]|nr:alpha-beta hydrolase superfamily lysophospholipase [Paraburkholderia sp. BL8N3]
MLHAGLSPLCFLVIALHIQIMQITSYKIDHDIAVTVRHQAIDARQPVVILCHGFCGIQELLLPRFAETFVEAGYAAVTFDYRGFGASGGERGRLVPSMQIDDIHTVIAFVKTLRCIDADRIGLWGTSLGGGHVFAAAASDPSIKAVISQLSFASGEDVVTRNMTDTDKQAFIGTIQRMYEKKQTTGREMFVAVTKVLTDEQSKAFVEENRHRYPAMDIKIPFLTVREILHYKPAIYAARVACPSLVVVAAEDGVNPPDQGIALFESVGSVMKRVHVEESAGHYDMYDGEHFKRSAEKQVGFFHEWL